MRLTTQTSHSGNLTPLDLCVPGQVFMCCLKMRSDHHYVGGYYGAASEEEMKRELVSCRNSCRSRVVHNVVGNRHFGKLFGGVVGHDIH